MTAPSYTITNESVTVILNGKTHTVRKGEGAFEAAREAVLHEKWDDLPPLLVPGVGVEKWVGPPFRYDAGAGALYYNDQKVPSRLNNRIVTMASDGHDPRSLLRFWDRLQANPSNRSVTQLFEFLDHAGIPIDEDGCILAYKSVDKNYKDHYSHTFDNRPGAVNKMPRNQISDDPRQSCDPGFHVGALSYAQTFGGSDKRVIIVKVDPAHVVSVPYDHSAQKMRVCEYSVVGNYGSQLPDAAIKDTEVETPKKSEVPAKADKPKEPKEALPSDDSWKYLIDAPDETLDEAYLSDLRKYARHHLLIVRASKIPGGKPALLERIRDVRRGVEHEEDE